MKHRNFFSLLGVVGIAFSGLLGGFSSDIRSETEIDVTQGSVQPSPIAITEPSKFNETG